MEIIELKNEYEVKLIKFILDIVENEYGIKEWSDDIKQLHNKEFKNNGGNCWIAIEDGNIIGTISLKKNTEKECEIKNFYIIKSSRGNGLGIELYNILEQFVVKNKFKKIYLSTYSFFDKAIKFYSNNNFNFINQIEKKEYIEMEKVIEKRI